MDQELLARVLVQPITKVDVVVVGKVHIFPASTQVLSKLSSNTNFGIAGVLGHGPFEDDVYTFVRTIEGLLRY